MKQLFIVISILLISCFTQAQIISTVAGIGVNGYTGDDSSALDAAIMPAGLTTDAAGNIYFGDIVHNVVRKIDGAGIITTIAGLMAGTNTEVLINTDVAPGIYLISAYTTEGIYTGRVSVMK